MPLIALALALLLLVAGPAAAQSTTAATALSEIPLDVADFAYPCTAGEVPTCVDKGVAGFQFDLQAGGGGGNGDDIQRYDAAQLRGGVDPDDEFPSPLLQQVANDRAYTLGYDASVDKCAGGQYLVKDNVDPAGTVTFKAVWFSRGATTGTARWYINQNSGQAALNASRTEHFAVADTTAGTVDTAVATAWTATVAALGWAAGEHVKFRLCRDADGDTMVGLAQLELFAMEVPGV